jgi:hypothetical protein
VHFALVDNRFLSEFFTIFDGSGLTRITEETRLVIEGCPRSGNSYALAAFRFANPNAPVASHRHSPTAVRAGLRRGKPVIVIIRRPRPTIASGLQYYPDQPPTWAIALYRRFHQGLLPMADRVVIATFEEVTENFGDVVRRCNARYGTDFVPYERTESSEKALAEMLDEWVLESFGEEELPRVSGRPSAARLPADEILASLSQELQAEIEELDKLYNAVLLHK